jgi:hypothetical protein
VADAMLTRMSALRQRFRLHDRLKSTQRRRWHFFGRATGPHQ